MEVFSNRESLLQRQRAVQKLRLSHTKTPVFLRILCTCDDQITPGQIAFPFERMSQLGVKLLLFDLVTPLLEHLHKDELVRAFIT